MNEGLKKNVEKYMKLKGIKKYTVLLRKIGTEMGKSNNEAIKFVESEKSNFSKMLNGKRRLNFDYVKPLEKILGVPYAKLVDEESYNVDINKEDIPFFKSFRYYAYKDDPILYAELDKMTTKEGDLIITNSDEYNRYFIDYLIEYRSYKGLEHLVKKYGFYFNPNYNAFDNKGSIPMDVSSTIEIAKFVIRSGNETIFNKVFNPFDFLIKYWFYEINGLYTNDQFIEAILNKDKIFNSLFIEKNYEFKDINKDVIPADKKYPKLHLVNPLLNIILNYCLRNLKLYKEKAIKILNYGLSYNVSARSNLPPGLNYSIDEKGYIIHGKRCCYTNLIYTNIDKVDDEEITKLLKQLQKI